MNLKYIIYFFLLMLGSLNAEEKTLVTKPNSSEKKIPSYLKPIYRHLNGEKQDPSISFTEIKDLQYGASLLVIFEKIPGKAPYRLDYKRLIQDDPNQYVQAIEQQAVLNGVTTESFTPNFGVLMPLKNYLPGERVTWRISSADGKVLKKFTCCPNPLVIKNLSGDLLLEAALISPQHPTSYVLFFPPRTEDIEFIFTEGSEKTKGKILKGESRMIAFEPVHNSILGSISKIELISKNKHYCLELPYGEQIAQKLKTLNQ